MQSEFKDRLKLARKNAKMTQAQLAKAVNTTQGSISDLESGRNKTSTNTLQIANVLQVNPNWLATGEGEMLSNNIPQKSQSYEPSTSTIEFIETLKEMEKNGELTPQVVKLLNTTLNTVKSVSGQRLSVAHLVETPE